MTRIETPEYRNPVRVIFGPGRLADLPGLVHGQVLIVATAGSTRRGTTAHVKELVGTNETAVFDSVSSNPTIDFLEEAIEQLRPQRIERIVAVGGGSAIDAGKVLSLALADPSIRLNDLIAGTHDHDDTQPLDLIAVPTTAGTGAEVTPFATVWDAAEQRKHSVTTPRLFPSVALVDPQLASSLPWEPTVGPGLDAWVQCFEAIWNRNALPVTTDTAQRGIALVPPALRRLKSAPDDADARSDMARAALLSGLAIGHTRTALAHSMSYPLTARLGLPHGLACALLLPAVLAFNLERDDGRLADVAYLLDLRAAEELVPFAIGLIRELGVNELIRSHVPDLAAADAWASEMLTPGRADNNMRPADLDDVRGILDETRRWMAAGVAN